MMRGKDFLEAFGNIDNEFLEEAMNYKKKKISVTKIVAAAACAALVIGTFPLINHFTSTPAGTGTTGGIIDAGTTGGTEDTLPTVIKLGESGEFTVWESSRHMSDDNALVAEHNVQRKIIVQNDYFIDEELIGTEKTIIMNGKTWTGKYAESINSSYYGSDIDSYICKQNGKVVYDFAINRETGRLEWFYATQYESIETPKNPLTQEECYEVALNYLKENFEDIEEYEMEFVTDKILKNAYNFTLFRKINGI
ncbi:MAG: hypothetical protein IJX55_03595, partial [Clostridia bacterium]|nr:hypothetical protein [Clostridia bacterium]